jgi:hypothetical protein
MRIGKSLIVVSLVLLAIVVNASSFLLWAQEVTANIVGTVTDPSGAPIKGATVVATDVDRGTVWNAESNESGAYDVLRLPVGTYSIKISARGFENVSHEPFTLVLNQTARVDAQMKVGSANETVEVSGAAPILQTQSVDVAL